MANNPQMRPIARGLRPPAPPKFVQEPVKRIDPHSKAFKTNVLSFQSVKKIRISHFDNGPFLFYVQTESSDGEFQQMTAKLQKLELRHFRDVPKSPGTACLARHDKKIYRAAIAKFCQPDSFVVNLVDFGFSATVKMGNLFHIPDDFLQFTFAMPFSLCGFKSKMLKVSEKEIGFYFRQLTENKNLTLKCVPSDGPPICQYCELYLDDSTNILEKLQKWDPQAIKFRPQNKLEIKKTFDVKVSYVDSAQEFYVHIQRPDIVAEYDATCDELYKMMPRSVALRNPRTGSCCAVLLGGDWYRGLVVGMRNGFFQIKIIDYGIIEEVPEKQVFLLPETFMDKPAFAFRCSLKGFEGMEVSENISTQFDIFCGDGRGERKVFKMNIDSANDLSYFVELEDLSATPPVNVNRMLLKNSRPLIETIQLENAKKRQRAGEDAAGGRDRNNSQRGRGNHMTKGQPRNQTSSKNHKDTSFESKESTPSDVVDGHSKKTAQDQKKPQKSKGESGWVSTLHSVNRAYVHFEEHISGLEKILDEMFAFYENKHSRPHLKELHVGSDCAARSSDGNWYRSRIESFNGDKVKVFHREYGNSETLPRSKLRVLDLKFAAMEELVVPTYFAVKPEGDLKSLFNEMMKIFEDGAKEFNFKVAGRFREGLILEPIDQTSGKNIIDELVRTKKAQRVSDKELMEIINNEKLEREAAKRDKKSQEKTKKPKSEASPEKTHQTSEKLEVPQSTPKKSKPEVVQQKQENPRSREKSSLEKTPKDVPKPEMINFEPEVSKAEDKNGSFKPEKADSNSDLLFSDVEISSTKSDQKIRQPKSSSNRKTSPKKVKRKQPEALTTTHTSVKLTALTSPTDFYISLAQDAPKFAKLHSDIQIIASGAANLKDFEPSTLCLVQQPFDNNWYRSRIIDSDEDMVTVRCLDDGKTFSVENFQLLKIMPTELAQKKFFGVACSLPVKIERRCEEKATEMIMQLMEDDLEADFVTEKFLELFHKGENLVDMLVDRKLAQRLEAFEPGKAYTSHINSLESFYLQFECDQLKLDVISQYFEEAKGEFVEVPEAKPGDIVAALYPDDNCWYRSRIEDVEDNEFDVTFIDYGNLCKVSKIGKISETSVIDLPKMSKHCCLVKPAGVKEFSETAEEKFKKICANGATILDVKMTKPGDIVEVQILVDGRNISEDLAPLCEISDGFLDSTLRSDDSALENLMSNE